MLGAVNLNLLLPVGSCGGSVLKISNSHISIFNI